MFPVRTAEKAIKIKKIVHQPAFTQIKKRNGRIVPFDEEKIVTAIAKALHAVRETDGRTAKVLAKKVIERLRRDAAGRIPEVEEIQDAVVATLRDEQFADVAEAYQTYRQKRKEIREMRHYLLAQNVKIRLTENAIKVLESRYLRKDDNGKLIETPTQLFQRVAQNIAAAEKIYRSTITDEELFQVEERFYRMMATLEFLPNSPTLMNAGGAFQQLSACFIIPIEDSLVSIFDAVKNAAIVHQSGGGTGFSISRLRPKGDFVRSTSGVASGPISFLTIIDKATDVVKQGGKRRGANMGILRVDHPDILDFITSKRDGVTLQNFNISVAATDAFMEALGEQKTYPLINPRNNQVMKELDAREVFDLIVRLAWETGDPGLVFIDRMNDERGNPTPRLGRIETTNPCGEVPMLGYESCNLGSIDVGKFVMRKQGKPEVDWERLGKTIRLTVRFLDNVIDMCRYPIPEIERISRSQRRIGLGLMGFADLLIRLEIPYNAPEALALGERFMKFFDEESFRESQALAEERGVFPNWYDSVFQPKGIKVRHCARTTIAPTGTIGIIAGCSQGIEPLFALAYVRKSHIGKSTDWVELTEVNPLFEEVAKREGFYSKALMEEIARAGSVRHNKAVPAKWRRVFLTAHDLTPKEHVLMQAAFQKYTDNAVSKTINFPEEATIEDVKEAYQMAYQTGCKGITIYRSGSKAQQVLNVGLKKEGQPAMDPKNVPPQFKDASADVDLPAEICTTCTV